MKKNNPVRSSLAKVPMGLAPLARARLLTGQKIIVIVGPTASGKSDLSIKIALRLSSGRAKKYGINGAEIISADSRQVYRGMDIGTGKVLKDKNSKSEARNSKPIQQIQGPEPVEGQIRNSNFKIKNKYYSKGIRHHLIDVASPKKQFTASDFKRLGEKALIDIVSRSKLPIIVGGTGFYIDILLGRMAVAQVPPNKKLRAKLEKQSTERLFKRFSKLDPRYSKIIDRHNRRRLVRALEIVLTTDEPIPPFKSLASGTFDILWIGLRPQNLQKRIKKRLEQRLRHGMIKEVKNLIKGGVGHKRLQRFGLEYKWLSLYLQNKISHEEMKENLYRDIVRYSKRQMTWFKRNKEIHWINLPAGGLKEAEKVVSTFLQKTTH